MPTETKPASYADLAALPETVVGELLNGELFVTPRPRPRHGVVATELVAALRGAGVPDRRHTDGWHLIIEPELRLFPGTDQIAVPDLAGWRVADVAILPPDEIPLEIVPSWVCEISSPSTARLDRAVKLPLYAEARVQWAWMIDPVARLLEIYQNTTDARHSSSGRWLLIGSFANDASISVPPFDQVTLDLSVLWL